MKAILFDLNGTMIDDMDYHTRAWLRVVNQILGGLFTYEQVKREMYGKNSEVLKRIFMNNDFTAFELEHLSQVKEEFYRRDYLPALKLLPGLDQFLADMAARHIPMAIASAALPANIDFVLDNLSIRPYFSAIVSADDVRESKPHPETFLLAAERLGVAPGDCLVFEDAPKGVEAAERAGMPAIVLTTMHQPAEFSGFGNIKAFWANYDHEDIFNL